MTGAFIYGAIVGCALTYLLLTWRKPEPAASVDERGNWAFPVDTMAQMLAIPTERRARFLAELPAVLTGIWKLKDSYPLSTLPGAVWVDDGLGELRPNIVNAPTNAGEAFATTRLASGIEAPSGGETQSGSTVGESPTAEGGDAQTPPESHP